MGEAPTDPSVSGRSGPRTPPVQLAKWMSVAELAAMFGVSPWTVYSMVHRGVIPFGRFGRRLVFNRADIEAWVRAAGELPAGAGLASSAMTTHDEALLRAADGITTADQPCRTATPGPTPVPRRYKRHSRKDLFG